MPIVVMDDRDFVGQRALNDQLSEGAPSELIGIVMTEKGVLRAHYPVFEGDTQVGELTSGAFSPTLQHSIGFARVSSSEGTLTVGIRNKKIPVQAVDAPFVRNGKQTYKLR